MFDQSPQEDSSQKPPDNPQASSASEPPSRSQIQSQSEAPSGPAQKLSDASTPPNGKSQEEAAAAKGASQTNPSAPHNRLYAPSIGSRIEVLWQIETQDEPEDGATPSAPTVQERWWGAVVQDCTNEPAGTAVKPEYAEQLVYILLYDAYGEFEDETARVAFLPEGTLVDLARVDEEDKGLLDWRIEGDEVMQDQQTTLEEFATEQDAMVQAAGLSTDADLQALSQMPANVQLHMTAGYRVFADGVKQMLRELVASKPPGYVITESDVQSIYARVKEIKERGGQLNVGM